MNLGNNFYVVGVLMKLDSKEWTQGKFNNFLVIDQPYEDRYGQKQSNYTQINISTDRMSEIQQFAQQNRGSRVLVPFRSNFKKGVSKKTGEFYAFNEHYLPKGESPMVLTAEIKKAG